MEPARIITEEDLEVDSHIVTNAKPSNIPQKVELLPQVKQRINNIPQKEEAMHQLGITRKKYMCVIIDALEAMKWADVVDKQGNVKQEYVPDLDKQRWGAEQAAKLFGDYIQHVDANIKVSHSVEQLLDVFERAKKRKLE